MALTALAMLLGAAGASAAQTVSVFPSPDTKAALPGTQITIRGVSAGAIGPIAVAGSKTGNHSGHIAADSDGDGGSFIPDHPFVANETVTVATTLNVLDGQNGIWRFQIANPAGPIQPRALTQVSQPPNSVKHFHSRPDLRPAAVAVTKNKAPNEGDIFVAPQFGPVQDGPELLDPTGSLIWFHPMPKNVLATDFRVQQYQGQPVLTWWQGGLNNGSGRGEDVIFNRNYQQIATVKAGNGLQGSDLHEFLLTPQGAAYIIAVQPLHWPGTGKPLMDSVIQEIDIKTGLVLFEWHAIDHVPVSESYFRPSAPGHVFDPFHANSVTVDRDGNLIVSMRNTWAAYKIDHQTGAVIWTLGSKPLELQDGQRHQDRLPARSPRPARRQLHAVRRRRRAAAQAQAVARDPDLGQHRQQERVAGQGVRPLAVAVLQLRGQRAALSAAASCSSAGVSSRTSRSSTPAASSTSTPASSPRPTATAPTGCSGAGSR